MLRRVDAWRAIAAGITFLVILTLLLSTPDMIFSQKVDVLDSELTDAGAHPQRVLANIDFSSPAQLQKLPTKLGNWTMKRSYQYDAVETLLDTNVMVSRDYAASGILQTVNLLIVESSNVSSFHPAAVCYTYQGWDVPNADGTIVGVHVTNTSWLSEKWLGANTTAFAGLNLTAKALAVTKDLNGTSEKRVALYAYVKREDWRVTDQVTWIRAEIQVPANSNDTEAIPALADLFASALPSLFTIQAPENTVLAEAIVQHWGWGGGVGVVVLLATPAVFFVGNTRSRRGP